MNHCSRNQLAMVPLYKNELDILFIPACIDWASSLNHGESGTLDDTDEPLGGVLFDIRMAEELSSGGINSPSANQDRGYFELLAGFSIGFKYTF